ncbi:hypothetical protein FBU59_001448 [Linderina macrospora]|uniref:Uncharacterized protein n=1 Tax=Linderina macrospora TaxID=4868 RepID=A0ACC1JDZ8_9FUNG|nr:hypothetical protein FBU59_001448 [Linderina macrospora]
MQESIAQLHVDTTNLSGASNDGDMAGSPFLRKAIPNPFKSADSTIRSASRSGFDSPVRSAGPSRPVSNKQTDASPKQPSSSKAPSSTGMADGTKRSLRSLEEAFKGMVIDSQPDALPTTGFYSPPTVAMLPGGHIRDAAPGLDSEREQPLPLPMSIPRTNSGTARTPQPLQRVLRTRPDDIFDTPPPPLFSGARGKSQPTSNMPIYSPATAPRAVTPQPPAQTFTTQPGSTHHPVPMLAPRRTSHVQIAHRSLSQSPDSHHSDYTASTRRLEALLGMGESSPRSTPNTPSPGDSTSYRIFKDLPQPVDLRDARSGGESRRRKQQTATTLRRQDSLKSNFPPFSFIMPRNKIDNPAGEQMAYSAGTRAHAVGTSSPPSRSDMALSNESLSPLADKNECDNDDDDEEMMFQMEASIE